jgi:molecular chaperone Hsp33
VSEPDSLRRFLFEDLHVRGELVHLDEAWRQVLANHDYPAAVRSVLGEAMAASVLLVSTLKFDGMLTLQIQGDGPMPLVVVQCSSQRQIRGVAKWEGADPEGVFSELTGEGRLAITIERRDGQDRYQGIVPLEGDTLAACLDAYFQGSAQVPTRLWLASTDRSVAGMLLQRLPTAVVADTDEGDDHWRRLRLLADTVSDSEMLELPGRQLLSRLFAEDDLRLFEGERVVFSCSCSNERVAATLRMLGRDEITALIAEEGRVEVRCEFCNKAYGFDAVDAEALFAGLPASTGSPIVH